MERQIKLFRVFIASPSDLAEERVALRDLVEKINRIFSHETDWRIELLGWEDTLPGAGRPQELINLDLDKADLFIGCLWRRWGTPTGNGDRTGFEEEFERALARRVTTGAPEMWLFFKKVDEAEEDDPGEQLKKVLAFRAREEKAKRLLFQHFMDVADWRERLGPLLHRHLLRLFTQTAVSKEGQVQSTSQTTPRTGAAATGLGRQPKRSAAVASVATLLQQAAESLQKQSLLQFRQSASFDMVRCTRLLIFAASLYAEKLEPVEFGTHEINSAFFHRKKLNLTGQERLFLLKTILLDDSLTKPGWYWPARWTTSMLIWLPWLIEHDRDDVMRARAINLANDINFALRRGSVIDRAISENSSKVRVAALGYLLSRGGISDLNQVERALQDPDHDVRTAAKQAGQVIRIRHDPDKEFRQILSKPESPDQAVIEFIKNHVGLVTSETLLSSLNHPGVSLRAIAADELRRRQALPVETALQLCTDESPAIKARGFLALIDQQAAPTIAEIRSELKEHPLFPSPFRAENIDADVVVAHRLMISSENELWSHVDLLDENSHLALRALCNRFFSSNRKLICDLLADDFNQRLVAAKQRRDNQKTLASRYFWLGEDPMDRERRNLRTVALEGLADHAQPDDRSLFQHFLSSDSSATNQTIACLRGLSTVGETDDINIIKPLLSAGGAVTRAAAARAYLTLSPNLTTAINDLLSFKSEAVIWVIVAFGLLHRDKPIWSTIKGLLANENDEIRRLICFYAVSVLPREDILRALTTYLKRGRYYYNVVVLFDRALYAPLKIRKVLLEQEVAHFDDLSRDSSQNWPGMSLKRK